jgi:hypothetical protein
MRKQLITKPLTTALMLGGLTMLGAGCSDNYYRVTHPTSGKEYYTTKVEDAGKGGAVKIKDAKTGSMVTLQSSDVKQISEGEYQAGMMAKATPKQRLCSQQRCSPPRLKQRLCSQQRCSPPRLKQRLCSQQRCSPPRLKQRLCSQQRCSRPRLKQRLLSLNTECAPVLGTYPKTGVPCPMRINE